MWINKKNKYHNIKVKTQNGESFDSRLEYKHFLDLQLLLRAGVVKNLTRQVRIPLGKSGKIKYVADFVCYHIKRKIWVIWDSKGVQTKEFKVKLAWLLESYSDFVFFLVTSKKTEEFENIAEKTAENSFDDFMKKYLAKKQSKKGKK